MCKAARLELIIVAATCANTPWFLASKSDPSFSGEARGADDRFLGTHSMRALALRAWPLAPVVAWFCGDQMCSGHMSDPAWLIGGAAVTGQIRSESEAKPKPDRRAWQV